MKSKHRSNLLLRKWSQDGYWCRQNDLLRVREPGFTDTIERVNVNDLTVEEFIERYEKGSRPCIITGVTDNWAGNTEWQLKVSPRLPSLSLADRVGSLDSGLWSGSATVFSRLGRVTPAAS